MSDQPVVGLVLNYRDAERTVKCINSLLNDGTVHVLVWDNSADKESSALSLQALLKDESRVSIETNLRNIGFAAGVNRGLKWICSRFPKAWILLINNDAIILSGAIDALTRALVAHPSAVIAYPTIDHGGKLVGTAFYQRHLGLYLKRWLPCSIPYASGCCQLLAPERLTGSWFDEDFFMYGEDVELGWRLGEKRMVHVSRIWVYHEGTASSGMGSPFYETCIVDAHWLLAKKLSRNRLEYGFLWLGRGCLLALRAIIRAIRYRSLTPIKSFWRIRITERSSDELLP